MTAHLYNFRGHYQLVDVPEQGPVRRQLARSASLPALRPRREVLPYVGTDREVTLLGSPARVAAELERLRRAGVLLFASEPAASADRSDRRVYVDVKLREYPWAPAPQRRPRRRHRRAGVIAAAVTAAVGALLGLGYVVSAALQELWALLVVLAPVLGGFLVVLLLAGVLGRGGRGCPGGHCPGAH